MMNHMLMAVLGFLLIIGPAVLVHEMGHMIMGLVLGFKVEVFSIGLGKKLISKTIGGIRFQIAPIPFGGYVKFTGQELIDSGVSSQQEGEWFAMPPWKRNIVAIAGPVMNILFAVGVFYLLAGMGYKQDAIGTYVRVMKKFSSGKMTPAADSGLKTGDKILAVNNHDVKTWNAMRERIFLNPDTTVTLDVSRLGKKRKISLKPSLDPETGAGLIGITPLNVVQKIHGWRTKQSNLNDGDVIMEMKDGSGKDVTQFFLYSRVADSYPFQKIYKKALRLTIIRDNRYVAVTEALPYETITRERPLQVPLKKKDERVQVGPNIKKLPRSQLVEGDTILSVKTETGEWSQGQDLAKLRYMINLMEEKEALGVVVRRGGKQIELKEVLPRRTKTYRQHKQYLDFTKKINVRPQTFSAFMFFPFKYMARFLRSIKNTVVNFQRIKKRNVMGGPLSIFYISGSLLKMGIGHFLLFMGMINYTLAFFNLLPFPALDGGHIAFGVLEQVRGRPLPPRVMEIIHLFSVVFLFGLMILVTYFDVLRFAKQLL